MGIQYDEDSKMNPHLDRFATYRRRWYILAIFSVLCFTQGMVWNTWGPVATSAEYYYGWTDSDVAMMANWGTIMYVVTVFFWSYLFDTVGSRIPIVSAAFCIALGTGLRIISRESAVATPLIHIAQILNGFAGPIALGGPPIISALWFPPRQRTTSTAITTIFSYLGVATAFVLGPNMVYEVKNATDTNSSVPKSNLVFYLNSTNSDEIRQKVGDQMWDFLLIGTTN
ncbi:uncharacterized protein TRIADDRAFT_60866 [Trichoplax adhaerens]|uniref:Major facilitator superfamily (MFS) profile domain-containing protein n=1 Tax=Trichoplax adhaerens TaxID=10228 RepID=B3S9D4_TRIAD|nr:hypothetical protein TRIADDRAFT_60866 [Trichoplax adhaerens]EDV20628.1 hypothetical protein TRIADDRAFT_60866 [Trichoplax adhaerens]|eukprot:XP_002116828.1 hypothetical protein TRIADDRAFT_60866 [Trichoplax adhaerens]